MKHCDWFLKFLEDKILIPYTNKTLLNPAGDCYKLFIVSNSHSFSFSLELSGAKSYPFFSLSLNAPAITAA